MVNLRYQDIEIFPNHVLAVPRFLQILLLVTLTLAVKRSMWSFREKPELTASQLGDRRIEISFVS